MPVLLEKREAGGAQVAACWNSCGGLGGNARFTMVSRGPFPQFFHAKARASRILEVQAHL